MKKYLLSILLVAAMILMICSPANAETEVMEIIPTAGIILDEAKIDPSDPLTCLLTGLYETKVDLEDGTTRSIYQYFPENLSYRQPEVAVAMPSDGDPSTFLSLSGWKNVADTQDVALVLLAAGEGGWKADEALYMRSVFDYMVACTYYKAQAAAFYMVGYGDASEPVMDFIALHGNMVNNYFFSGAACFDVDNIDLSALETAKTTASPQPGWMLSDIPMPMWLGAKERTETVDTLVEYWKAANDCADAVYSNEYAAEIYEFPATMAIGNELTETHTSKVLLTLGEFDYYDADFTMHLYKDFLMRTRRYDSSPVNMTRYFASNTEKGMEHVKIEVNGVTREFYVQIPTAVKNGQLDKVPVLFAYHGGTCSGEDMPTRSGWDKLAEDKNFIAVYPTGTRSTSAASGLTALCRWSAADVDFFKATYDYVMANYPTADPTRFYLTGQSNGGGMSHNILAAYPELITAMAVTSMVTLYDENTVVNGEDIIVPLMYSIGDLDYLFVPGGKVEPMVEPFREYWFERYHIDETFEEGKTYQNGRITSKVFTNDDGVPLFRWNSVAGKTHAVTPDELPLMYDFMSQFTRVDGVLYYMGEAVELD